MGPTGQRVLYLTRQGVDWGFQNLDVLSTQNVTCITYLVRHAGTEGVNNLICNNQTQSIHQENRKYETGSKKWWDTVHKITERKRGSQNVSSILSPSVINRYFKEINTDSVYSIPQRIPIAPGTRIPALEVHTVQRFLARQKRTAPGPDWLPHWIWRDFSHLLALLITKQFNRSLQEQFFPCHWKLANIRNHF